MLAGGASKPSKPANSSADPGNAGAPTAAGAGSPPGIPGGRGAGAAGLVNPPSPPRRSTGAAEGGGGEAMGGAAVPKSDRPPSRSTGAAPLAAAPTPTGACGPRPPSRSGVGAAAFVGAEPAAGAAEPIQLDARPPNEAPQPVCAGAAATLACGMDSPPPPLSFSFRRFCMLTIERVISCLSAPCFVISASVSESSLSMRALSFSRRAFRCSAAVCALLQVSSLARKPSIFIVNSFSSFFMAASICCRAAISRCAAAMRACISA
mmetsp:Transcript_32313/g.64453  ORF Transcript_32313/g.64453 Transcript_32313/m.64453 type:complete len:264 (-) Transcript_32313:29-820(-)